LRLINISNHDAEKIDVPPSLLFRRSTSVDRRYPCPHPGHKPPVFTDSPSGRYAGALFSAASKSEALQTVAKDITHLRNVIKESAPFREVLKNSAVRRNKQKEIFETFAPTNYSQVTINFLNTLIDSGRYPSPHPGSPSSKRSSRPTLNTARSSTKKKTSASSQPSTSIKTRRNESSLPSSKTNLESNSESHTRSIQSSWEVSRYSQALNSWIAHFAPASKSSDTS
jgi:hypothetical protein